MSSFLLYFWIIALVEVQCFRTPLPFGTGFQGASQDDQLSGQEIFHLLGNAFKHALSTNATLDNFMKFLKQIGKPGGRMETKYGGEKLRCRPGPGWPRCNLFK